MIATNTQQERLRSKVVHAAAVIHEQGPITTFIHTNPLHGLEHLPFEQAVAEAERITGGRGYLPNEEFRRLYRSGRITAHDLHQALVSCKPCDEAEAIAVEGDRTIRSHDVLLVHLLYGVEALDPAHLPWQIHRVRATKRFREDLPEATRTILLDRAKTDLRVSMDRIGRDWTLSDWVQTQLNLDLSDHVYDRLSHEMHEFPDSSPDPKAVDRWFDSLEIPLDRREGYRRCIDRHLGNLGAVATEQRDAFHSHWLKVEYDCLHRLLPCHLGVTGTFSELAAGCEQDLEAYAVTRLWHVALAVRGLDDPLFPTNPDTVTTEDPVVSRQDALHRRIVAVEEDRSLALPLIEALRAEIEEEIHFLNRRREQRQLIQSGLRSISEQTDAHRMPPLTLTEMAETRLRTQLPRGMGYPTGLMRLTVELRLRKGFDWQIWNDVFAQPLFVSTSPVDDGPWRTFLRSELRIRLTEDLRHALQEKFSSPRRDRQAETLRLLVLDGLKEEGLTLLAWEALQNDVDHWDDPSTKGNVDPVVEERLCRIVMDGLRQTELTRPAYDALRQLIEGCGRTVTCRQLLADLQRLDPRQHLVKHAHDDLTAAMR
ncbi:MAG: putative inorganic carbon transporter subunit DabA, partial [Nitrospiraceae bacterium]